jgi:threonine dehydrogenase-like Zn-dependent dehydrogenase
MKALTYTPSIAKYVATRANLPGAGALALEDIRPPRTPGPDWLPVRPRLTGICGSDLALLSGKASLHLATLTSTPFVPGHEIVGEIGAGPRRGERVVVQPALGCLARGLAPPCAECAQGLVALCRHTTDGVVSAGLQTGFCRDSGGGWSEGLVAHTSQLHSIPDDRSDEDAVLVEPLACALHAAEIADVQPGDHVAIIGAGTIGLLTLAAVRVKAPSATLIAVAKHAGQQTAARRFGADDVCAPDRLYVEGAGSPARAGSSVT